MNEHVETLAQIKSTIIDLSIKFGPKVLVAIMIMVAGYFAGRWVGRIMHRGLLKIDLEPPVRELLVRVVRIFVLGLFAIMALQNLGVELLPLIAGVGLAGAGIALAMQGVLGNLVAGLTIIFTRPFRVGEYISMLGVEGRVETISLFNSVLSHPDLSRVVIPNRKIVGEILHNFGTVRQLHLALVVPHASDLTGALAVAREVVAANGRVLDDPAPVIGIAQIETAGIRIGVNPWVRVADVSDAEAELYKALAERFRAAGIDAPPSRHEVRVLDAPSAATARLA